MVDENGDTMMMQPPQPTVHERLGSVHAPKPRKLRPQASKAQEQNTLPPKHQPADVIDGAKKQLNGLLGHDVDGVAGFDRVDEGWHLTVTVIELHRIPAATDVLALYEVELDETGNVVSYHRGRRFYRDQVGDGA